MVITGREDHMSKIVEVRVKTLFGERVRSHVVCGRASTLDE